MLYIALFIMSSITCSATISNQSATENESVFMPTTTPSVVKPLLILKEETDHIMRSFKGRVVDVISGNEIRVSFEDEIISVFYQGVEIPMEDQDNALRARELNEFLVYEKTVNVDLVNTIENDSATTLNAYVFTGGEMVNLRMIRSGFSTVGNLDANGEYFIDFHEAQAQAENMKLGIWEIDIINSCGTLPCQKK